MLNHLPVSIYIFDHIPLENFLVILYNFRQDEYSERNGGKWHIDRLRLFIEQTRGRAIAQKLFEDIQFVILQSLKACQVLITTESIFRLGLYQLAAVQNFFFLLSLIKIFFKCINPAMTYLIQTKQTAVKFSFPVGILIYDAQLI